MTTPERSVEDLIRRLNTKADILLTGERITWGSGSAIMREAAEALKAERQKREEAVEAERERVVKLWNDHCGGFRPKECGEWADTFALKLQALTNKDNN